MAMQTRNSRSASRRNLVFAIACCGVVAAMAGAAYASVPLYRLFCQVTGFGGTTRIAAAPAAPALARMVTVRFDANTAKALGWRFAPLETSRRLAIGETTLAFFRAENTAGEARTGSATFNVTPDWAGAYFNKIECFCFTEQTLQAGESVDMPVAFFVDPAILDERAAAGDITITLSYTFYPVAKPAPPAEAQTGAPAPGEQKAGSDTGGKIHG